MSEMDEESGPGAGETWSEGLRERKKRLTRALISDTAMAMFLDRGFDDVKVADIADACGVSEKTVYNYFPTKESLLFDREAELAASLWGNLGPDSQARSPVVGILELIEAQLEEIYKTWLRDGMELFRRFAELIDATPSLQTAQRDMSDRLERTAAEALAARAGISPDDPEPRIAAASLVALWRIYHDATRRYSLEDRSADETRLLVTEELRRAARVVESGLWWFGTLMEGRGSRQQFKAAGDAAQLAGRQVVAAIRQARAAWEQLQREGERGRAENDPVEGLSAFFEHAARWKREFQGPQDQWKDEWKQAYREQQARLRESQRELQRQFRQASRQHHQGRNRTRRDPGSSPPGPSGWAF